MNGFEASFGAESGNETQEAQDYSAYVEQLRRDLDAAEAWYEILMMINTSSIPTIVGAFLKVEAAYERLKRAEIEQ